MKRISFALKALGVMLFAVSPAAFVHAAEAGAPVLAKVGDIEISRDEFEREVYSEARQTFYHGSPPATDEFIEFRKAVAETLVNRKLLLKEAGRRGIGPDEAAIDARLAVYEDRYGDTERWQTEGEQMIAALRTRFEEDSILEALETAVKSVTPPEDELLRAFYDENPSLFTEPAQNRVSLIPGWQAARDEAARILEQLEKGESFEELARLHSSDPSARMGGDMGFQHSGRLGAGPEAAIEGLQVGDVSEPVRVLEGMAIFKLTERRASRLRSYDDVRGRAEELWVRQQGERQWQDLVADLRSTTPIEIDTEYLASLPGTN